LKKSKNKIEDLSEVSGVPRRRGILETFRNSFKHSPTTGKGAQILRSYGATAEEPGGLIIHDIWNRSDIPRGHSSTRKAEPLFPDSKNPILRRMRSSRGPEYGPEEYAAKYDPDTLIRRLREACVIAEKSIRNGSFPGPDRQFAFKVEEVGMEMSVVVRRVTGMGLDTEKASFRKALRKGKGPKTGRWASKYQIPLGRACLNQEEAFKKIVALRYGQDPKAAHHEFWNSVSMVLDALEDERVN